MLILPEQALAQRPDGTARTAPTASSRVAPRGAPGPRSAAWLREAQIPRDTRGWPVSSPAAEARRLHDARERPLGGSRAFSGAPIGRPGTSPFPEVHARRAGRSTTAPGPGRWKPHVASAVPRHLEGSTEHA